MTTTLKARDKSAERRMLQQPPRKKKHKHFEVNRITDWSEYLRKQHSTAQFLRGIKVETRVSALAPAWESLACTGDKTQPLARPEKIQPTKNTTNQTQKQLSKEKRVRARKTPVATKRKSDDSFWKQPPTRCGVFGVKDEGLPVRTVRRHASNSSVSDMSHASSILPLSTLKFAEPQPVQMGELNPGFSSKKSSYPEARMNDSTTHRPIEVKPKACVVVQPPPSQLARVPVTQATVQLDVVPKPKRVSLSAKKADRSTTTCKSQLDLATFYEQRNENDDKASLNTSQLLVGPNPRYETVQPTSPPLTIRAPKFDDFIMPPAELSSQRNELTASSKRGEQRHVAVAELFHTTEPYSPFSVASVPETPNVCPGSPSSEADLASFRSSSDDNDYDVYYSDNEDDAVIEAPEDTFNSLWIIMGVPVFGDLPSEEPVDEVVSPHDLHEGWTTDDLRVYDALYGHTSVHSDDEDGLDVVGHVFGALCVVAFWSSFLTGGHAFAEYMAGSLLLLAFTFQFSFLILQVTAPTDDFRTGLRPSAVVGCVVALLVLIHHGVVLLVSYKEDLGPEAHIIEESSWFASLWFYIESWVW